MLNNTNQVSLSHNLRADKSLLVELKHMQFDRALGFWIN